MNRIILFFVVLHSIIIEEIWSLDDDIQGDKHIQGSEECDYCFSIDTSTNLVQPGSVTATCNVEHFLSNTLDYMNTRRLIYEHVVNGK